jgi:type III secretion protein Q
LNALPMRRFPAADVDRLNRIAERLSGGQLTILGQAFRYELQWLAQNPPAATKAEQCLFIDWGGAHFELRLPADVAARLYAHALGEEPPLALAAPLATALMDMALEAPMTALETLSGRRVRLSPQRPSADFRYAYSLVLDSVTSKELIAATVLCDSAALILLTLLARRAPEQSEPEPPADMPLVMRLEVGYSDLRYGDLAGLAVNDLIVLDQAHVNVSKPSIVGRVGVTARVTGILENGHLTITSLLESAMPEHIDPAASGAPLTSLDDIAVRVTFDVGERMLTLGELKAMKVGHVFNLAREPQRLVTIRANGRPIGHGELVAIDERVGVAVHELLLSGVRVPSLSAEANLSGDAGNTPVIGSLNRPV